MKAAKSIAAHLAALSLGVVAVATLGTFVSGGPAYLILVGMPAGYASAFLFAHLGR